MSQPIRVQVEKKNGCGSGCATVLAVCLVIGLLVEYWYVALALVVVGGAVALLYRSGQKKKALHRPGPRDPWLNEVAVAVAEFGYVEHARNTGTVLGGVPLEGDIELLADRFQVYVSLFATDAAVHEAYVALLAKPETRKAVDEGRKVLRPVGHVLYVANGRGGVVDESRLNEVIEVTGRIPLPAPLADPPAAAEATATHVPVQPVTRPPSGSTHRPRDPGPDVLEQLQRLGELHTAGVLSDEEFTAKKAELLRRI